MENGVYTYVNCDDKIKQVTYINVMQNGVAYGKKSFIIKEICFTFVKPELIFPAFRESKDEKVRMDYSPLVISANNSSSVNFSLMEDSRLYNFYVENYKKCNINFKIIEHLYEEYILIKKTFSSFNENLNI